MHPSEKVEFDSSRTLQVINFLIEQPDCCCCTS